MDFLSIKSSYLARYYLSESEDHDVLSSPSSSVNGEGKYRYETCNPEGSIKFCTLCVCSPPARSVMDNVLA